MNGRPTNRLHGLRMLNPEIFRRLPLSSGDSTNVARSVGMDGAWRGPYQPSNRAIRARILVERIEALNSASEWTGYMPNNRILSWNDGPVGFGASGARRPKSIRMSEPELGSDFRARSLQWLL
jgi:hypothetical protein